MKFHWELNDGPYRFKKNINYVIYFKGCFAPPHIGHFSAISDIVLNNPNVKVIINQVVKSERRHGVPYEINKKIWQLYIDNLLPKNRVDLHKYQKLDKYINHPFMKDADKVIYLRANENFDIDLVEKRFVKYHKKIIKKFNSKGIDVAYYAQERNATVISATKFIEQLIKYKETGEDYYKLRQFIPEKLPLEIFHQIINMILSCNIKNKLIVLYDV